MNSWGLILSNASSWSARWLAEPQYFAPRSANFAMLGAGGPCHRLVLLRGAGQSTVRTALFFAKKGRLTPARMRDFSWAITNANGANGGVAAR
jgi:hypothetical protein